jgi:hypothetical protein
MRRYLPFLFAFLIPAALFAQARPMDSARLLKSFGLDDSQISQVQTIEKSTRDGVKADITHIRLIQAQIQEALLPATPDLQAINSLIDKKGQLRTEIDKLLMSARLQLVKIMGPDNSAKYFRLVMSTMHPRFQQRMREGMLGRPQFMPMTRNPPPSD